MRKVVIDTDVVIDYLRQPQKKTLFKKLIEDKALKIILPAICLTELYVGKSTAQPKEKDRLEKALKKTELILADRNVSQRAGALIREYSDLYLADALVAATAIEREALLCTFNKTHFEKISALKIFNG